MEALKDLIARMAKPGRVEWIGLRPERLVAMQPVSSAKTEMTGLVGDHAKAGKRAVTFLQAEHLQAIASFLGKVSLSPDMLRRNIVVSGINLSALRGRELCIGESQFEITGVCAPCSRMEKELGFGGYSALRGHGGFTASVTKTGVIAVGQSVRVVD